MPYAPAPVEAWATVAAAIAGRPRVRVSRDGGRSYPARAERGLTTALPEQPAAVLLYDATGDARCLAADFDIKRGGRDQVDADAAAFAALVAACGGTTIADLSPNGGRHVYVLWSRPLPISELRPVMRALAALYPSLDPTPMLNPTAGCIRPPGARHRTGGHQSLTTPIHAAQAAVRAPCGPPVWAALLDRLTPQLDALAAPPQPPTGTNAAAAPGARLSARIERIARTGVYDSERYRSPSEARQAVITAAAATGWTLPQITTRIQAGTWPGLAGLYTRYRPHARRQALDHDWQKAHDWLSRKKNAHNPTTRESPHTGGTPSTNPLQSALPAARSPHLSSEPAGQDQEYRWIRSWWSAALALEPIRWSDRAGLSKRLVLRALGAMAQRTGSRYLEIGRRNLALACGLDDSTVSEVLRALRDEEDPVIDLLEADRGEKGDLYALRIPDAALEAAAWRRWRAGRIEAIHPCFRVLGAPAALAYQALTGEPLPRRDLTRDAVLPPRTLDTALQTLAEHGLAERVASAPGVGGGWRRGPIHPDTVAAELGADQIVAELIAEYAVERAAWRALLDARAARRAGPTALLPGEATPWPAHLVAPEARDADDRAYDAALAAADAHHAAAAAYTAAVDLLHRELGATVLARTGS